MYARADLHAIPTRREAATSPTGNAVTDIPYHRLTLRFSSPEGTQPLAGGRRPPVSVQMKPDPGGVAATDFFLGCDPSGVGAPGHRIRWSPLRSDHRLIAETSAGVKTLLGRSERPTGNCDGLVLLTLGRRAAEDHSHAGANGACDRLSFRPTLRCVF
jgi:hypothetical protein